MQPYRVRRPFLSIFAGLLVLLGSPLLVWAAAQDGSDGVMRVQQQYYPESLDPHASAGTFLFNILSLNYEGLTRLDGDLNVVPAAAERWEFSADNTTVTFHLREGLTYSDGSPLTADRFADAVRRTCDPTIAGEYQHILFDIVGCQEFAGLYAAAESGYATPQSDIAAFEAARADVGARALDDRTLEIQLTHPAPYFPAIAGSHVFYPVKQELIAQGGEGWSMDHRLHIGNGPFRITRMEPGQLVVFAANDRYWGGRPALDGLEYVYVADSSVALEAYRVGDLDIIALDPGMRSSIEGDPQVGQNVVQFPGASTSLITFNLAEEPFSDKRVREAFAYAFDRETYCQDLLLGGCVPALSWIPPDIPGHISTDAYAFDPEMARRALAASSYGGPERLPEITFIYWVEDPVAADRAEWIAGQYRDILGVEITLQPLEGQALNAMMSDPATYPSMAQDGWVQDYPDPQNWLSVYWACWATYAPTFGYCNPELDALLERADSESDPDERLALYEEAGHLLVADAPAVFKSHANFLYLVKPRVSGYEPTAIDSGWPGQTASLLTVNVGD